MPLRGLQLGEPQRYHYLLYYEWTSMEAQDASQFQVDINEQLAGIVAYLTLPSRCREHYYLFYVFKQRFQRSIILSRLKATPGTTLFVLHFLLQFIQPCISNQTRIARCL